MKYTLQVTESCRKVGKYSYVVVDENGKKISERKSNRIYQACTMDGTFYFGRLGLAFKGDHKRTVEFYKKEVGNPANTPERTEHFRIGLEMLTNIAILDTAK